MIKTLMVIAASAVLWMPYYIWGVGVGNDLLSDGRIWPAALIVSVTVLFGFMGLFALKRYLIPQVGNSSANYRLLLILSTQVVAVVMIAIDSSFNLRAILAGVLVVIGAVVGTYALDS